MPFESRIADGVGLEGRNLSGWPRAPREPDAVDTEMSAQVPAAPAMNVSKTQDCLVYRRLLGAPPVSAPGIKRPARARGDAGADADRPILESAKNKEPIDQPEQGGLHGRAICPAISSSG